VSDVPCEHVSPRELVRRVLAARFASVPRDAARTVGECSLVPHQAEAVGRLTASLRTWRGALLGDDVGMGKTFTALGVIADFCDPGSVVIAVPAAVRGHWSARLRQAFANEPARPTIVTHGQLSRGWQQRVTPRLVIVDEAHVFRTPRTRRYRALASLCRGAPVLLVTATPVINTLLDLYFQVRLFAGDGAFRSLGVDDLHALFRTAAASPRHPPAAFRRWFRTIATARGRDQLTMHGTSRLALPRCGRPRPVRYSADLTSIIAAVEALELPWFRLAHAGGTATRSGTARGGTRQLLLLLLCKRLDSSPAAFRASLQRLAAYNARALDALRHGMLLRPAAARGSSEHDQLAFDALIADPWPRGVSARAIERGATADRERFDALLRRVAQTDCDPKLDRLKALLGEAPMPKTIVFTSYRDTGELLWIALRGRERTAFIHGNGAALGFHAATRAEVIARFAPISNAAPTPRSSEDVRLLIATDAIAEGVNLQDAERVVSYDLPWNPFRLRQRIGRVDRLGCPHERVHAYSFLPLPELDAHIRMLARLARKRAAAAAVRTDRCRRLNASQWTAEDERLRALHESLRAAGAAHDANPMASARWLAVSDALEPDLLAFAAVTRHNEQTFWMLREASTRWQECPAAEAHRVMAAASRETAAATRDSFCEAPAHFDAASALASLVAATRPQQGRRVRRPQHFEARLAKRIREALRALAGGPPLDVAAEADRILRRCRTGFDAGEEAALRRVLALPLAGEKLIARLSRIVDAPPRRATPPAVSNAEITSSLALGMLVRRCAAGPATAEPQPWSPAGEPG
jgi:hypothetical protein